MSDDDLLVSKSNLTRSLHILLRAIKISVVQCKLGLHSILLDHEIGVIKLVTLGLSKQYKLGPTW